MLNVNFINCSFCLRRVENKDIFVDLKKNSNGVYLKLSERNGKSRNTVMIPVSGISRLKAVLEEVLTISSQSSRCGTFHPISVMVSIL
jgi:hypothetical protein